MNALPRIDDDQRRTRLGTRQAISPAHRVDSVLAAAESVVCLHSTEPASVYLSTFARAEVTHADLETALYADRTLVKQLAMRRTCSPSPTTCFPRPGAAPAPGSSVRPSSSSAPTSCATTSCRTGTRRRRG